MSESHSTAATPAGKPAKPDLDNPLYARRAGV
jgi:hypothetical protein